jgi:hypothetical protein
MMHRMDQPLSPNEREYTVGPGFAGEAVEAAVAEAGYEVAA